MTDPNNKIFMLLGEIKSDQASMKKDIAEIKDGVSDYKQTKNRLIGWCIGISTTTGAVVSVVLGKLGIHI